MGENGLYHDLTPANSSELQILRTDAIAEKSGPGFAPKESHHVIATLPG